jgi:CRP-like cAMP-binding protein/CheY-like chemotaxis protein
VKKILLIEDDTESRESICEILQLAGYKVSSAASGKLGMEMAIATLPDLIICDIMMPASNDYNVLDGYGVLHMLHKNKMLINIPFIFLSAKSKRAEVRKGMEMGADDFITKPFNTTELLNAVESRLKRVQQLKQNFPPNMNGLNFLMCAATNKHIKDSMSDGRNVHHYQKKQEIYTEGAHPVCLFYVLKGKVRTYKRNDEGKELVIGLYNEGDFIGYTALLEQRTYKESAEVLEDAELVIIPEEDFETLLFSNPKVMHKFMQLLSKNVTEKEEQLLGIAYNSLRKKVSTSLLSMCKKYNPSENAFYGINISRDILAALTGVAKESLIRTLGDFRDEHLLKIKDGQIFVTDMKKLEEMIN